MNQVSAAIISQLSEAPAFDEAVLIPWLLANEDLPTLRGQCWLIDEAGSLSQWVANNEWDAEDEAACASMYQALKCRRDGLFAFLGAEGYEQLIGVGSEAHVTC